MTKYAILMVAILDFMQKGYAEVVEIIFIAFLAIKNICLGTYFVSLAQLGAKIYTTLCLLLIEFGFAAIVFITKLNTFFSK